MGQDETDNLFYMTRDGRQQSGPDTKVVMSCLHSWLALNLVSSLLAGRFLWIAYHKRRAGTQSEQILKATHEGGA